MTFIETMSNKQFSNVLRHITTFQPIIMKFEISLLLLMQNDDKIGVKKTKKIDVVG